MTGNAADRPEVGEELLYSQLTVGDVVIMIGTHRPAYGVVGRLVIAEADTAVFDAFTIFVILLLRVNDKGQFFDDRNHRIAIHKYLGELN